MRPAKTLFQGGTTMEYCGIDAHSKSSTVCVINELGEKLMSAKTPSTEEGLGKKVGMWDICMPIVIEACSTSRPVISHLRRIGFENVIVVNPQATSQMRARGKKTDYVDAQGLAELARLGLADAWRVHIPGDWAQRMRDMLYAREFVIKHRVAITNRVKAIFRREGKMSPSLKGETGWRKISELLPEYTEEFEFYRRMRRQYLDREVALTGKIKSEVVKHPQYEFVKSVPNVGPLTAAILLACIDDISRFRSARVLASYFGIVPSVFQSGATEKTGSITKRGNALARKFLAQAAHHSRYLNSPFNAIYRDIAHKKSTSVAVMTVARKIVTSVYAVMKHNELFDPTKMGLLKVDQEVKFVREYERAHKVEAV
jgi:transposase